VGTAASMLVTSMYAYAASVKTFKHRNILAMLAYIPMVFSAGILPWFIVLTRYYHLSNKVYALIVPCLMNLFYVFLIRNFFSAVPVELSEAAKIDGAGHARIFTTIVVPVARVGLITVALFYALGYWNDFYMALMFISKQEFYPLQYFLYTMLTNAEFAAMNSQTLGYRISVPLETIKMALTCVTIGPIVLLFPFIQKYFAKGIVVGGIKG
jgi:putative aldouronate transport system permease protein